MDSRAIYQLVQSVLRGPMDWLRDRSILAVKIKPGASGQVLLTGSTGSAEWGTASGSGVSDHGLLTGLADDDHAQYHNDARGDARYWQLGTDLATQVELNTHKTSTDHDGRYYTEAEVDTFIAGRASDAELTTVSNALDAHIVDAVDAHDASAVSFDPAGRIYATGDDVQEAVGQLDSATVAAFSLFDSLAAEINTEEAVRAAKDVQLQQGLDDLSDELSVHHHDGRYATPTQLSDHVSDAIDAHEASAITNIPSGTTSSTNVQAAINEIATDVAGLAAGSGIPGSVMDAAGDLIVGTGADTYARLAPPAFSKMAHVWTGSAWVPEHVARMQDLQDLREEFEGHTHDARYFTRPSARVSKTAAQSIGTGTWTTVTWVTEDFDRGSMVELAVSTSRITATAAGTLVLHAQGPFTGTTVGGERLCRILKNGAVISYGAESPTNLVNYAFVSATAIDQCVAGDYYEFQVQQDSGAALNFAGDVTYPARFAAAL